MEDKLWYSKTTEHNRIDIINNKITNGMLESGKKVAKKKSGNGEGKISEDPKKLLKERTVLAKRNEGT